MWRMIQIYIDHDVSQALPTSRPPLALLFTALRTPAPSRETLRFPPVAVVGGGMLPAKRLVTPACRCVPPTERSGPDEAGAVAPPADVDTRVVRGPDNAPPRDRRPLPVPGALCPPPTEEWLEVARLAVPRPDDAPGGKAADAVPVARRLGGAGTALPSPPSRPFRSVPVSVLLPFAAVRGNPAGAEATEEVVLRSSASSLCIEEMKEVLQEEARERATTEARWLSMISRRWARCRRALFHELWGRVKYSR